MQVWKLNTKAYMCSTYKLAPVFFNAAVACYVLTFGLILPLLCHNLAYSIYNINRLSNRDMIERGMQQNSDRLTQANSYLSERTMSTNPRNSLAMKRLEIVICIVTVVRKYDARNIGYLTQVVAQVDKLMKEDMNIFIKDFFICNTHPGPGKHEEADTLGKWFEVIDRFRVPNASFAIMDHFDKERDDYVFCLGEALSRDPKYVIMLEDDAVPNNLFLPVLNDKIRRLENRMERQYSDKWLYLKLFYPERWSGYGVDTCLLCELLGIGLLGGTLSVFILILTKPNNRTIEELSNRRLEALAFLIGSFYLMTMMICIGRPHILHLRQIFNFMYKLVPSPDCCSPCLLYTSDMAKSLQLHLRKVTCHAKFPIDFAIDSFANQNSYARYMIEPNLVKHIGMISSTKGPSKYLEEFIDL